MRRCLTMVVVLFATGLCGTHQLLGQSLLERLEQKLADKAKELAQMIMATE